MPHLACHTKHSYFSLTKGNWSNMSVAVKIFLARLYEKILRHMHEKSFKRFIGPWTYNFSGLHNRKLNPVNSREIRTYRQFRFLDNGFKNARTFSRLKLWNYPNQLNAKYHSVLINKNVSTSPSKLERFTFFIKKLRHPSEHSDRKCFSHHYSWKLRFCLTQKKLPTFSLTLKPELDFSLTNHWLNCRKHELCVKFKLTEGSKSRLN